MQRIPLLCALVCILSAFSACRDAIEEVPLSTSLIALTDKFFDVEALSAEKAVVVGYAGKILLTTDGGQSWQAKDSGTNAALYSVAFPDGQHGWISGQDGVMLHSTDGGETWQPQDSQLSDPIFAMTFIDTTHGWAAADRATYLKTTNGGESWESGYIQPSLEGVGADATLALVDPIFYDVQFLDENTGWIVGEFGKIYHTTDGGRNWVEQQNSLLGQAGFSDALNLPTFFGLSFSDANNGVVVGLEGKVATTSNAGQHWTFIGQAEGGALFDTEPLYAPHLIGAGDGGWIVGGAGRVLRLQGGEWQPTSVGMPIATWLRAVDFYDADHGWIVGGYGAILRTTDGGQSWLRVFG
jgi:photosystem II stability/assembly factor-like uncharacterized protein